MDETTKNSGNFVVYEYKEVTKGGGYYERY
jgi:hypothetical protein